MIFATVGTHHQPFARFVRIALALAADDELVIQHGHTAVVATDQRVRWHRWLAPASLDALMREATSVVTHAGVATIVAAVRAGHRPLVVARRAHLGEHVDDHQLQIVDALSQVGLVVALDDRAEVRALPPGRVRARPSSPVTWPTPGLKHAVRGVALGE